MRIHIPIGNTIEFLWKSRTEIVLAALMAVVIFGTIGLIACPADAQEFPSPEAITRAIESEIAPQMLVSAQTADGHWRSAISLSALPSQSGPADIHVTNGLSCLSFPVHLEARGTVYVRDFAPQWFCGGPEFQTFPLPAADAFTVLSFDDGKSRSSFVVPPIGAIVSTPQRFGPIVSDAFEGTWINVFASETSPLTVDVYNGANQKVATETFTAKPPVTQYRILTNVSAGWVVISQGYPGFGFVGSTPVYGFISVGTPLGGNLRTLPFGQ